MGTREAEGRLALGQGTFYVATGVWPLVHLPSSEVATGPELEGRYGARRRVAPVCLADAAAWLVLGWRRAAPPEEGA